MKFLVDNNLPPKIAKVLQILDDNNEVVHLKERFPENTPDEEWMELLGKEKGWGVLTHDRLNKGLEREALRRAGLVVFFLDKSWGNYKFWDMICQLLRWWPRIVEQADGVTGGAAFKVSWKFSGKGKFEQVKI